MAYFIFIIGLLFLIFIHEGGHFLMARKLGIAATKFYVGFPPALFKFHRNGVEYGIGAIMLGGYVKIPGMFKPVMPERLSLLSQLGQKLTPAEQEAFAALQKADEAESYQRAQDLQNIITSENQPDRKYFLKETVRLVEDLDPGAYWRHPFWKKFLVIFAGPLVNIVFAFLILWMTIAFLTPIYKADFKIDSVQKGSAAQEAGLQKNDTILSWDGVRTDDTTWMDKIENKGNERIPIEIMRDGKTQVLHMTPEDGRIGVSLRPDNVQKIGYKRERVDIAAGQSAKMLGVLTWETMKGIGRLMKGQDREEITTIVGLTSMAPEIQKAGQMLTFIAFLSFILAFFNLLPLLPLDGGHILFAFIERVIGRAVPPRIYERVALAGLLFMLFLFAIGLNNDLTR